MDQDQHGVDVTFERAQPRRFDLVVGTDGLHSAVRPLAFGPEPDFVRHMGLYVATVRLDGLDGLIEHGREVVMCNTPGRAVAIHPSRGDALAFFAFRSPAVPDFDYRDTSQHKQLLAAAFASAGWQVPELLQRVHAADDLYFDSVSQVRVRPWSRGRVALVGDAASCVSLFGDGSSLAMAGAGACTLAEELAPAQPTTSWPSAATRPATGPSWTPGSGTSRGRHRCSSRRPGPASWPATWPPGCGRSTPPPNGCDGALPLQDELAEILADRLGERPDNLEVRIIAAAVWVAAEEWQAQDGEGDLGALIDQALGTVLNGALAGHADREHAMSQDLDHA